MITTLDVITRFNELSQWMIGELIKSSIIPSEEELPEGMFDGFFRIYVFTRLEGVDDHTARQMALGIFVNGILKQEQAIWPQQEKQFDLTLKRTPPEYRAEVEKNIARHRDMHEKRMQVLRTMETLAGVYPKGVKA